MVHATCAFLRYKSVYTQFDLAISAVHRHHSREMSLKLESRNVLSVGSVAMPPLCLERYFRDLFPKITDRHTEETG